MSITLKLSACLLAIVWQTNMARAQSKSTPLAGTSRLTEIKPTRANAQTIHNPQPGLLIFTEKYYSLMIIESDGARAGLPNREKSTASELLAVWGPFLAAAGTYDISGTTLTTRPMVAKNSEVMAPGNVQINTIEVKGNTLKLTRVRNENRPVAHPTTLTFTRVE